MKKILFPLISIATLALAQNPTIAKNDPFSQMDKMFQMQMKQMELMQKQMDEMFKAYDNSAFKATPMVMSNNSILSSGLQDKGDHYEVVLNVGKGNVKADVKAKDGLLTIKVSSVNKVDKNSTYGMIKSYSNSSYMQSFTLPKDANSKKISYDLKDGKLVVKIDKVKK